MAEERRTPESAVATLTFLDNTYPNLGFPKKTFQQHTQMELLSLPFLISWNFPSTLNFATESFNCQMYFISYKPLPILMCLEPPTTLVSDPCHLIVCRLRPFYLGWSSKFFYCKCFGLELKTFLRLVDDVVHILGRHVRRFMGNGIPFLIRER